MRYWAAMALALSTLVSVATVRAQSQVEFPPPPIPYPTGIHLFPIVLVGHPSDLKLTLSTEEGGKPFLYCTGRCEALAYSGDYWVSVRSTADTSAGTKRIRVSEASEIHVRPRSKDADSAPSTVGVAMLGGGLGLFALAVALPEDDNDAGMMSQKAIFGLGGLGSIVAGVVLVIVGSALDTTTPEVSISP